MYYLTRLSFVPAIALLLWACASSPPEPSSPAPPPKATSLYPGDAIRIQVWREADLSGTFTVDERGIVTLPLLGQRDVRGMAPADLRTQLLSDYGEYLQNPSVEVTLLRRINILGEVRNPGLYPVDATVSLADALALAGGITPNGNPNKIRLIRDDQVIVQNMDQATALGAADVRSGDQIDVGQRGWVARNTGAVVGSIIAASAIVAAAVISN